MALHQEKADTQSSIGSHVDSFHPYASLSCSDSPFQPEKKNIYKTKFLLLHHQLEKHSFCFREAEI